MGYKQTRQPNIYITDVPGYCHRFARRVFDIPAKYQSAKANWLASTRKGVGSHPTNVAVPVWFTVRGHSFGHVVAFVPGVGYLSTPPGSGTTAGRRVYASIAEVERAFGATYVGWTYDVNDVAVAEWVPDPSKSIEEMATEVINGAHGNGHDTRRASLGIDQATYELVRAEVNRRVNAPTQRTYTVQRGDSLSKIGAKFGIPWKSIYDANRAAIGDDPNRIYSGLVLVIP